MAVHFTAAERAAARRCAGNVVWHNGQRCLLTGATCELHGGYWLVATVLDGARAGEEALLSFTRYMYEPV